MDDRTQKACDFAADLTKQLITLATGIITLTVTFSADIPARARWPAFAAWLFYLASVLLGIFTLMSMTAELQPRSPTTAQPSIWTRNTTVFSKVQIFTFLAGVLLTAVFGLIALQEKSVGQKPTTGVSVSITLN